MSNDINFRKVWVECAASVMHCSYCCSSAAKGDRPQTGWVGREYQPGRDIVVLLQNPGVAPKTFSTQRETGAQRLLKQFSDRPGVEAYSELVDFMLADMAGTEENAPWAKWTHPVSKLIVNPQRLAWLNVVKFRTPGESRKDDPVTSEAVLHSVSEHLPRELRALNPRAVISIGVHARTALDLLNLPPRMSRGHLKLQGSSNEEVANLRSLFLTAGS